MKINARRLLAACVLLALMPILALAYIGPRVGLSALGTVVALIGAFLHTKVADHVQIINRSRGSTFSVRVWLV